MKAVLVTCPHCGARLKSSEASDSVTCEYCGTASRIQRRTRVLERVMPPPPSVPGRPLAIAVQRRSPFAVVIPLLSLLLPIAIVIVVIAKVGSMSGVTGVFASGPTWQGTESMLLVDLDGDGAAEVIGRSRRVGNSDEIRVIALDGMTGKPRWESEPVGTYSDTFQGFLTYANELVLYTSPRAEIRAFAIKDGSLRWKAKLSERVARFCARGDTLIAIGTDDVERALHKRDGTPASVEAAPAETPPPTVIEAPKSHAPKQRRKDREQPRCAALPTDAAERERADHVESDFGDVGISSASLITGPGGRVLSGLRNKGTRVPTLVALDDANKARWKVEIPPDPLGMIERAAEHVLIGDHEVCAAYYTDSVAKPLHLACFAIADGRRLWDGAIPDSPLSAIELSGRTLLISTWGTLEARDLTSGATRWSFGRSFGQ